MAQAHSVYSRSGSASIEVLRCLALPDSPSTGKKILPVRRQRELPKGVYRSLDKFRAEICIDKQNYYLGTFDTPEDASAAFKKAYEDYYG